MQDEREFFVGLQAAFAGSLQALAARPQRIDALLGRAFEVFERNLPLQCEGEPALACRRGCAACCTLRVTATAPEVLAVARWLRAVAPRLAERGIDLAGQVRAADARTRGQGEAARVGLRQRCPFIAQGVCVIYPVRPLACRGHASHDERACADAAAGRRAQVPHSEGHRRLRGLVQNAMQSALRDAGLAWASYELNQALVQALDDAGSEPAWLAGQDVFARARVDEVNPTEMAQVFDLLKPGAAGRHANCEQTV
jgi:Fe-S-cluster containining protein